MNTDDLDGFTEQDEPQLSELVLSTALRHHRMPTGAELAAAVRES